MKKTIEIHINDANVLQCKHTRLETRLLDGECAVYPGHPLTVAYVIANKYASLTAAQAPTCGYPAALADNDIPGAGVAVYSALDFLRGVAADLDKAIERANLVWRNCDNQAVYNPERYRQGQAQADQIVGKLKQVLETWQFSE